MCAQVPRATRVYSQGPNLVEERLSEKITCESLPCWHERFPWEDNWSHLPSPMDGPKLAFESSFVKPTEPRSTVFRALAAYAVKIKGKKRARPRPMTACESSRAWSMCVTESGMIQRQGGPLFIKWKGSDCLALNL